MPALETVINATLEKSRGKLIMASMRSNALTAWVMASNRVETEDGGRNITNPLIMRRNPNVTSYQYYDRLPVNQTNEFETARYEWSRVAGTVIISGQEQDENKGEAAIFKLISAKMQVLEESITEKFSQYHYAAGGGTDPLGLAALVPNDPTTGTLGGINRTAETQWRTSSYDFAGGLNAANIEEAFDDIMLDLKLKSDKPDVIVVGRNIYRLYAAAVRDKANIPLNNMKDGARMADLGFVGFTHQNVPLMYDEDCPDNRAYFINSKYLRMHVLSGVNFRVAKLNSPWDMDAVGSRVTWQGQWCLWRAYRTHAVLNN